jgi:vitamin B12 transporter
MYARQRRTADAHEVWSRGAALFPGNTQLRARVEGAVAAGADGAAERPVVTLQEIVVATSGTRIDDPHSGVALRRVDVMTVPGGTADLMHALQTGPGTTVAMEGSDLYVRGGDPAETPVWIDGSRIFYAGRYESLNGAVFGILDPAVLRSAFFSSGGFSARYGNALSGVLDVQTEDMPAARTAQFALNTVQAGASLQLPITATLGLGGGLRATEGSAMLAMHGRGDEFAVAPRALEGIGSLVWEPRPGAVLKATALVDGDRAARLVTSHGHEGAFDSRGGNRMLGLSGRLLSTGGRASARGSVAYSERTSGFEFGVLDQERTDRSVSARIDGELEPADRIRVRAGAESAAIRGRFGGAFPTTDQLGPGADAEWRETSDRTEQVGGYVEGEALLHPRVAMIAGVRTDRLPGEEVWTLDPRLALAVRPADDWTLRLGGGIFHQGRWRTRYSVPNAFAPSGTPRRATHLVAGAERTGEPSLKVEAFTKWYDAYVPAGDGPPIERGRTVGGDAIVRWSRQERVNGWITYSILDGRIELADGVTVPSAVDVTHSLTGVGMIALTPGWQLGATARYATGRPYTRPDGEPHAERLPDYRRIDARLTRFSTWRNRMMVSYLELLNVVDHRNVSAYTFDAAGERQAVPAFFRRTAVAGFSISF